MKLVLENIVVFMDCGDQSKKLLKIDFNYLKLFAV